MIENERIRHKDYVNYGKEIREEIHFETFGDCPVSNHHDGT